MKRGCFLKKCNVFLKLCVGLSKIIITLKNKPWNSLVKLVISIISIISSKMVNYFWVCYFWRVVILGGSLLLGFPNTWEILLLLSEICFFRGPDYYFPNFMVWCHKIWLMTVKYNVPHGRQYELVTQCYGWQTCKELFAAKFASVKIRIAFALHYRWQTHNKSVSCAVADDLTHEEWVKCNVADDGDMMK